MHLLCTRGTGFYGSVQPERRTKLNIFVLATNHQFLQILTNLNLRINFFFIHLLRTFCPHLGSFCVVSSSLRFGQISPLTFFRWLTTTSDRNAESCKGSPVITAFHSCCLSHHVFDQVNLWICFPCFLGSGCVLNATKMFSYTLSTWGLELVERTSSLSLSLYIYIYIYIYITIINSCWLQSFFLFLSLSHSLSLSLSIYLSLSRPIRS